MEETAFLIRVVTALPIGPQAPGCAQLWLRVPCHQGLGCLQPLEWLLSSPRVPLSCSSHLPGEGRQVLHCSFLQQPQVEFWQGENSVFSQCFLFEHLIFIALLQMQ